MHFNDSPTCQLAQWPGCACMSSSCCTACTHLALDRSFTPDVVPWFAHSRPTCSCMSWAAWNVSAAPPGDYIHLRWPTALQDPRPSQQHTNRCVHTRARTAHSHHQLTCACGHDLTHMRVVSWVCLLHWEGTTCNNASASHHLAFTLYRRLCRAPCQHWGQGPG